MSSPLPFALWFQADYQCRHSGACCAAGWPIPIDHGRALAVRALLGDSLVAATNLLSKDGRGVCACYDRGARRCAIHARLGLRALPISCAHFPRRLLIEDDRVAISLSHYCPTVADLLFDASGTGVSDSSAKGPIVGAPRLLDGIEPEGLDARGAWPPLLRPGVLAGVRAYRRWETAVVGMLATARGGGPESALAQVRTMTDEVARWTPGTVSLEEWVAERVEQAERLAGQPPSESRAPVDWGGFGSAVGRYLAAKAFGSWVAYQGDGLHAVVASVVRALDVLREEAGAACVRAGRPLDRRLLTEALGQADLRLMHSDG